MGVLVGKNHSFQTVPLTRRKLARLRRYNARTSPVATTILSEIFVVVVPGNLLFVGVFYASYGTNRVCLNDH